LWWFTGQLPTGTLERFRVPAGIIWPFIISFPARHPLFLSVTSHNEIFVWFCFVIFVFGFCFVFMAPRWGGFCLQAAWVVSAHVTSYIGC
jgi:hypothetical protein